MASSDYWKNIFEENAPDISSTIESPEYQDVTLAGPSEEIKDLGGTFDARKGSDYVTSEALVDTQLARILEDENPYIKAAKNAALKQMNRRGLLSSSLAIDAATQAAIKSALPMAQQNAQLFGEAALKQQATDYQSRLANQGFLQNLGQMWNQANLNAAQNLFNFEAGLADKQTELAGKGWLARLETGAQGLLNNQQFENALNLAEQEFGFKRQLSDQDFKQKFQLQTLAGDIEKGLQDIKNTFDWNLNQMNLDARTRDSIFNSAAQLTDHFLTNYTTIMRDANISDDVRNAYLQNLNNNYLTQMDALLALGAQNAQNIGYNPNLTIDYRVPFSEMYRPQSVLGSITGETEPTQIPAVVQQYLAQGYQVYQNPDGTFYYVDENGNQIPIA